MVRLIFGQAMVRPIFGQAMVRPMIAQESSHVRNPVAQKLAAMEAALAAASAKCAPPMSKAAAMQPTLDPSTMTEAVAQTARVRSPSQAPSCKPADAGQGGGAASSAGAAGAEALASSSSTAAACAGASASSSTSAAAGAGAAASSSTTAAETPQSRDEENERRSRRKFRARLKEEQRLSGLSKKEFDRLKGFPPKKRGGDKAVQQWHGKWSQPR